MLARMRLDSFHVHCLAAMTASAPCLVACGTWAGGSDSATGSSTTDSEPTTTGDATSSGVSSSGEPPIDPPADPAAFFLPARKDNTAYVVRISPETGEVAQFGPALPPAADDITYQEVRATADGELVAARGWMTPGSSLGSLWVGDGSGWKLVTEYNKLGLGEDSLSSDVSLMWFDEIAQSGDDVPTYQAKVITMEGKLVFAGAPLGPNDRLDWEAFGADGSWFAFGDPTRGLVLRTLVGDEAVLPGEFVHLAFAGSAIVLQYPDLHWVDLAGQPLAVAGFAAKYDNVSRRGYQVADGTLSVLGDGAVTPLQAVPAELGPDDVHGHAEDFAVGWLPDTRWSTIGPDGAVVANFEYAPTPNIPDFGELQTSVVPVASCLACATRTIVFDVSNTIVSGDEGIPGDASVQLWEVGPDGATTRQYVLRDWSEEEWGRTEYHFSADGDFLVWAEGGALRRLDVQTSTVETLETPFVIMQ